MIKKIREKFISIDKKILKVMNYGFKLCLFIALIASLILLTYDYFLKLPDLYYSGLLLFKSALFFFVDFIVCGFAVDKISKEII